MDPIWLGPYEILDTDKNTGNYKLDFNKIRRKNVYPWFATERLKKYYGEKEVLADDPDIEMEYEIDMIVDDDEIVQTDGTKKKIYRVRWKGYPLEEDT